MAKEELAGMLRVYCIDPDSNKINLSLGISNERAEELINKSKRIWKTEKTISGALEKISLFCKNANELCYINFYSGDDRGVGKVEHVLTKLLKNPLIASALLSEMKDIGILVDEKEKTSSSELLIDEDQEVPMVYSKSTKKKTPDHPGTF